MGFDLLKIKKGSQKGYLSCNLLKMMENLPILSSLLQEENFGLFGYYFYTILTLLLLIRTCPVLANSVDPDQLASEEANWSRSALFVIKYVNFYQRSSNLIG